MKIICSQTDLAKGVNIVSKAVPVRSTMAILECILIDASTNEIKLMANDMEIGIETVIEGTIEQRGTVAIDAKFFGDLIRKLDDSFVTIETNEKYETTITCEKTEVTVSGLSGEDFAYLPAIARTHPIKISQLTMKDFVRQTIFSISMNENNKLMTGALFHFSGSNLKVVTLDGNRISIRNVALNQEVEEIKAVVPGKTLNEVSKILGSNQDDQLKMFITENHIIFEFDQTVVVSRLIEGEYFKIDQMLSSDYETKVIVNKQELLSSIDRASIMAKEGDKKPIILEISDTSMQLSIESMNRRMYDEIEISKEGKNITIGFNPKYLIEALRCIDDENVSMYMMNPKSPCIIRDDADTYSYIILPININNR